MEHPLRTYRLAASMSLDALAERVNVAKSTLSRIETRRADPSLALIRKLREVFPDLTANDFMTDEASQ